jgi:hypothetical protein
MLGWLLLCARLAQVPGAHWRPTAAPGPASAAAAQSTVPPRLVPGKVTVTPSPASSPQSSPRAPPSPSRGQQSVPLSTSRGGGGCPPLARSPPPSKTMALALTTPAGPGPAQGPPPGPGGRASLSALRCGPTSGSEPGPAAPCASQPRLPEAPPGGGCLPEPVEPFTGGGPQPEAAPMTPPPQLEPPGRGRARAGSAGHGVQVSGLVRWARDPRQVSASRSRSPPRPGPGWAPVAALPVAAPQPSGCTASEVHWQSRWSPSQSRTRTHWQARRALALAGPGHTRCTQAQGHHHDDDAGPNQVPRTFVTPARPGRRWPQATPHLIAVVVLLLALGSARWSALEMVQVVDAAVPAPQLSALQALYIPPPEGVGH